MRGLSAATGLLLALWGAAALVGTAAAAAPATRTPARAVPACTSRQLAATVDSSSGAGGTIVLRIAVRNDGTHCRLAGYPALRLRKGSTLLPTRTVHGGLSLLDAPADAVALAPGARAYLLLVYVDRMGGCPETSGVDLWLPGWRRPVKISAMIAACDGGTIRTSPFLHPA